MNLEYKLLWFEDTDETYEDFMVDVALIIKGRAFLPIFERHIDASHLPPLEELNRYDLILMDYNLAGTKGDDLVKSLRLHDVYTDIVFYSANGPKFVRETIANQGVDGVYCAGKDDDDFMPKIEKIIIKTIKRIENINNLRGLVMAETSELDEKMIDIIGELCSIAPESKKVILDKTIKNRDDRLESLKVMSPEDIDKDGFCKILESSDRLRAISRMVNGIKKPELIEYAEILSTYEREILKVRNMLAHVKKYIDALGKTRLKSRIKEYEDFEFTEEICKDIRKNILKHSQNLENINKNIYSFIYKGNNSKAIRTLEEKSLLR